MLQNDSRLLYSDIVEVLFVTEGTFRNRMQRMREAGMLNIVALVDPLAIKYQADAILVINVASPHTPRQVAERLSEFNEVVNVLWVSGRFDIMVEVVCDSTKMFPDFSGTSLFRFSRN